MSASIAFISALVRPGFFFAVSSSTIYPPSFDSQYQRSILDSANFQQKLTIYPNGAAHNKIASFQKDSGNLKAMVLIKVEITATDLALVMEGLDSGVSNFIS